MAISMPPSAPESSLLCQHHAILNKLIITNADVLRAPIDLIKCGGAIYTKKNLQVLQHISKNFAFFTN